MGPAAATKAASRMRWIRSCVPARAEVVVVPLLVSSYSGHYEQVRYLAGETDSLDEDMTMMLHMSGITRSRAGVPVIVTKEKRSTTHPNSHIPWQRVRSRWFPPRPVARCSCSATARTLPKDYAAWMSEPACGGGLSPCTDRLCKRGGGTRTRRCTGGGARRSGAAVAGDYRTATMRATGGRILRSRSARALHLGRRHEPAEATRRSRGAADCVRRVANPAG